MGPSESPESIRRRSPTAASPRAGLSARGNIPARVTWRCGPAPAAPGGQGQQQGAGNGLDDVSGPRAATYEIVVCHRLLLLDVKVRTMRNHVEFRWRAEPIALGFGRRR